MTVGRVGATLCAAGWAGLAASAASKAKPLVVGRVIGPSVISVAAERVMSRAAATVGVEFELRELPLLRSLEMANNGEIDADLTRIADVGESHPNLIRLSTPISRVDIAVYSSSPDIATRTRADIMKMRVGIVRGTYALIKHTRGMNVGDATSGRIVREMMAAGRFDLAIQTYADAEVSRAIDDRAQPVYVWPYLWASEPLYFWLNRRHEALVAPLAGALRVLEREGFIDRTYRDVLREAKITPLLPEGGGPPRDAQRPSRPS